MLYRLHTRSFIIGPATFARNFVTYSYIVCTYLRFVRPFKRRLNAAGRRSPYSEKRPDIVTQESVAVYTADAPQDAVYGNRRALKISPVHMHARCAYVCAAGRLLCAILRESVCAFVCVFIRPSTRGRYTPDNGRIVSLLRHLLAALARRPGVPLLPRRTPRVTAESKTCQSGRLGTLYACAISAE